MSSAKYLQKRVGYLGAVQSFRPDTEVLMLATNLLKKDLVSASSNTITLPIITLPHIITSSLAMSLLSDLLPRLTHSSPSIRKKTIVTLYRLALVYPETLRPAWPKIKERLMDEDEDSSVTAAIVNVVCELGWRRPQDFLPLAPRLFELLVDSGNNWMAIKLIKLFATLTPLEPRLVKKLLPPLTSIIRTTPAMSLLYECINGIIQGGILGSSDDSAGGEEIATLCVSKLRGMIMVDGDPNLKFVALLAFNRIVLTHSSLVAQQEDVILDCIDSPDMSIRLRALDLVVGMVSADNLMSIVGRLMRQLRHSQSAQTKDGNGMTQFTSSGVFPTADSDDESPEIDIKSQQKRAEPNSPLPDEYKIDVVCRILEMCSSNNYGNLMDFEWYLDVLVQLFRNAPLQRSTSTIRDHPLDPKGLEDVSISEKVADELRNVAVKVKDVRSTATRAAESILQACSDGTLPISKGALRSVAWTVGEFAPHLSSPEGALTAILHVSKASSDPEGLAVCLQAMPKIFAVLAGNEQNPWTAERKTLTSLLMARIIHGLDPLAMHPDLEVQERAVEYIELFKLSAEASAAEVTSSDISQQNPPLLLTQAIPSLFTGFELKSVAPNAQRNVPIVSALNLDRPINPRLAQLLQAVEPDPSENLNPDDFEVYYHHLPATEAPKIQPAIDRLVPSEESAAASYQYGGENSYPDSDTVARRRAERLERNRDDPYYIAGSGSASDASTPLHTIIQSDNGTELDIDSIPIMQLDLGRAASMPPGLKNARKAPSFKKARKRVQVAADETLATSGTSMLEKEDSETTVEMASKSRATKSKQSLLLVDSSNIGSFSLESDGLGRVDPAFDYSRRAREEAEMAKAMQEVENLRLEMQRANERIRAANDIPPEGTLVKKKTKKKPKASRGGEQQVKPRKKKTKKAEDASEDPDLVTPIKSKETKKSPKVDGSDANTGGVGGRTG
ncbi:MAG: AP-3 complex subunit delta [Claussenomyces sp. TS43310]|nr:MAG: AP-3 complex subunit delta [Claussenomyces sp. TS43310]